MSDGSQIGELFRRLRESAIKSQAEIERAGGPKQALQSRIERGEIRSPSDETIRSYAHALGMSVERLRMRIQAAEAGQVTEPLRLGFIHGISAAPIIAMLMDGQLGTIIAASLENERGEWVFSDQGKRPDLTDTSAREQLIGLQAHSLQKRLNELDLIVAPSDRIEGFWKEGGPLLRYAQISSEPAFDFLAFAPKRIGPPIATELIEDPSQHLNVPVYYPLGTLGEDYATALVGKHFEEECFKYFSRPIGDEIEGLLKAKELSPFRAIVPYPLSSIVEKKADKKRWTTHRVEMREAFVMAGKLPADIPRYPVDILIRRESQGVVEWLNGDEYDRFSELLKQYEDQLSFDRLQPMQAIVRNIAQYLGETNISNCLAKLKKCPFNLMHYPEFTRFILNVRTRRFA